mgnify:CR=1 FL=1
MKGVHLISADMSGDNKVNYMDYVYIYDKINERLNSVEVLKNNPILRADISDCLNKIYDIEFFI